MRNGMDTKIQMNSGTVFAGYVALILAVYILPAVKLTVPYIIAAMLMLIFLPIAMMKMNRNFYYFVLLIGTTGFVFFLDLVNGIYGNVDAINEAISNFCFFLPAALAIFALRFCTPKQQRIVLIIFAIISVLMLSKTMSALEQNSWITRILAQDKTSDSSEIRAYRMDNVGGFEFSYMIGVVTLCLTWAAIRSNKIIIKILCLAGTVICFNYIIQTMYTTLLILTAIGIILLLVINTKNIIVKIILILGSIVLIFSLASLSEYLSGLFGNSLLAIKFMKINSALTGGGADALGSRPAMIMEAVRRWWKSPLWGGYAASDKTHSLIFSILERTGLIGFFSFLSCFIASYKIISVELKKKGIDTVLLTVVFLYVFALAVLNPVGFVYEVTIAAFFITPLWSVFICSKDISKCVNVSV